MSVMKKWGALFFLYALSTAVDIVEVTDPYIECLFNCVNHEEMLVKFFIFVANVWMGTGKFKGWTQWNPDQCKSHFRCKADVHDHPKYAPAVVGGSSPSSLYGHFACHNAIFKELLMYVIQYKFFL